MSIDGPIESFSPFHNINCPKGFLYFNKQVADTEESKARAVCRKLDHHLTNRQLELVWTQPQRWKEEFWVQSLLLQLQQPVEALQVFGEYPPPTSP